MRVAVMGSGGIGGYFGARLALGGAEVGFIARGAHLEAIQRDGIKVDQGSESFRVRDVRATNEPADIGPVDLVMLCVKLWDTETALEQIRPLVGPQTTLVSFQNSVLKDSLLTSAFPESQIIGGVAYVASTISQPGVIARTGPLERLVMGEFDGSLSARVRAFYEAALAGGINADISEDITRATWEKFVFLVGLSATTTTIGLPIGPIRSDPQTRTFLLDVMREVVAVARAHGVALPDDYAEQRLEFADSVSPEMTSSMAHDLAHGNRLELPWLSGAVTALGREAGIDTPLNRAVSDILALHSGRRVTG
jgi:2-dehydropantoate 2-reductase